MIIWLEDLLDEQDDAEAVSEGEPVSERQPTPEREPRGGAEPSDEDATVDVDDQGHDPAVSEAAIADDDGWSLVDIDAARFTRH